METQKLPKEFKSFIETLLSDEANVFWEALNESSPVSIRQNSKKKEKHWQQATEIEWCKSGKYLSERPLFTADPYFHAGCYYVQEAASMFLEQFLNENIEADTAITALDLCAAPGGKTTHLISLLNETSTIVCNEIVPKRNAILCENITKWGTANTVVTQNEAKDFLPLQNFFDLIVVDAPCSGEGMFRKDVRAIAEWSEKNVQQCNVRQVEILENIIGTLKENGILLYSTCTFEPSENEEKVKWLCSEKGFEEVKLKSNLLKGIMQSEFGYRFYPHKVKSEGFYIACLRKKSTMSSPDFMLKNFKKQVQVISQKQVPSSIQSIVETPDNFQWFLHKNLFNFTNQNTLNKLLSLEKFLTVKQAGTSVGELKGSDVLLDHAAAVSIYRNGNLPNINLEKEDALKFLKGESLNIAAPKGWLAVLFEGICIGWVKSTASRLNNHYPKHWKIRMDMAEML